MSKTLRIAFATGCLALGLSNPALADDTQVNTYTTGNQIDASVGLDADGDFVVVWASESSVGTDTDGYSIQGQRFASDGTALGIQFQVNTYTPDEQVLPSVALDSDGDFVVVWQSYYSPLFGINQILGQRYASDGSPRGGEFQVNSYTSGAYFLGNYNPVVSVDADGDFVVVWQSYDSPGTDTDGDSIQAKRFSSDGAELASQFQVNTYTTDDQLRPSVSLDADGDFVVVWDSDVSSGTDTDQKSVQAQRYASDGSARGGEFQVNTYTTDRQLDPSVGLDADGDFVVTWESDGSAGSDSSGDSIQGQRYASDGTARGGEFQVNSYTSTNQGDPSVGLDADGDFVIVWRNSDFTFQGPPPVPPDTNVSIRMQRYASDGAALSIELQVNSYTTGGQYDPSVSIDDAGEFVVVWQSDGSPGTDTSQFSIQRSDAVTVPVELMRFQID